MTVKWYGGKVLDLIEQTNGDILDVVARRLESHIKRNIRDNNQVRTGFMSDSTYVITPKSGSTYSQTPTNGTYRDRKTGQDVRREKAPEASPSKPNRALIGVAADYALFPELQNSFAFRAVDQVDMEMPEIVKEARRRGIL